jgi:sugar transferase (PEP-CTERM/EpsH1 system associated)
MRVLFLALYPPYPPNDGGRIRTFNILKQVAERHEVCLITFADPSVHDVSLESMRTFCAEVISVPKPAARQRSWHAKLRDQRRREPIALDQYRSREMADVLRGLAGSGQFDVVHVDHIYLAQYVEDLAPLPAVLTHHNVEAIAQQRILSLQPAPLSPRHWFAKREHQRWARYEAEISRRFAALVTVSKREAAYFQERVPGMPTFVVPNGVDTTYFQPADGCGDPVRDHTLLFTGRMDYPPNVDAVTWFCQEVFPLIRQAHPTVRFSIVGRDPTPEVRALADLPGVTVVGAVPDMRPHFADAAVCVVPLRLGAGTRLKILESMAAGVPVVSTSLGCEGLDIQPDKDLTIANTVPGFAGQVCRLIESPRMRAEFAYHARARVEQEYDWRRIAAAQERAYECAIGQR